MWGAIIRVGARYAFFRRWKNTIILAGGILLCGVTIFLVDAKLYLSAGLVGIIVAAVMLWIAAHYVRERRAIREREVRQREEASKREAAAAARSEKIDKVKASAAGVAKGVSESAVGLVGAARTGISSARERVGSWRSKP